MGRFRLPHILLGAAALALLVALFVPVGHETLLLQNELGAPIPFLVFFVFSVAPAARAGLTYTSLRARAWIQGARTGARESWIWLGLFLAIALESLIDPAWTRLLGYDLTPLVHRVEGDAVAWVQATLRPGVVGRVLDVVGSAVYSYGYAAVYAGVIGVALLRDDLALARPLLRAFLYVWAVGLPAYLFLPVNEPWFGSDTVVNVLHTTIPPSATNPLLELNINNELPSLHSALSIACALTLWRIGRRTQFWLIAFPALTLPFFVVYLGIHWVIDAVTGVLLGLGAAFLATRGTDETSGKPEIPPPRSRADQP